ncbi:MAG: Rnase Y domain-containing protein, partial [Clostridia bacterium]
MHLEILWIILAALIAGAAGTAGGYQYRKSVAEQKIGRTEEYAKNLLDEAQRRAEDKKKETVLAAKEEVLKLKSELDRETRERRNEIQRSERRLTQREETFDKKLDNLDVREESLNKKQAELATLQETAEGMYAKQLAELERIGSMTLDEARQVIMNRVQKEAYHDAAVLVRETEARAKEEADKKARNIIALAIQKCASDHV